MANYEVTVSTGNLLYANTFNNIYIKLVGTDGESNHTWLLNISGPLAFNTGAVSVKYSSLCLLLIELNKHPVIVFPEDAWFPNKVEVKSPEGQTFNFPIYRWITDSEIISTCTFSKSDFLCFPRWHVYEQGIPRCMKAENTESLPLEVHFSFTKTTEFLFTAAQGLLPLPVYVQKHWKEDEFFAYQFLNGVNPMLIRQELKFPDDMIIMDLQNENIYLCDYKLLDGVEANTINGIKQYLMAPLVLLQRTPDDKLMPIAIQLKQTPGDNNPIFCPTDSEYDWLMAKIFVRSADFNFHELNIHLLRTHLLAEVFAVSLLRNVPMVHPLYKLLIPHTRYSLQINLMARNRLISKDGTFTKYTACGGEGMFTILKRSMASMTYSSLCIPDDIAERGMEAVPNYYYRDDGLKLWDIIHKFVKGILNCYYKSDADVEKDSELQKWISDIFVEGFLSNGFSTVAALVKFVTMVIFTCSVQHSAVNSGQYDYGAWMPNTPISLQLPPPTTKGTTSEATMLETFPDVNVTVQGMAIMHLLSPPWPLSGQHFFEKIPCKLIKEFQGDLEIQSVIIKVRNENLDVPYTYMNPTVVENSVAI
uniref:Arachidonate 15-lipoxygenase B-like n=1 Tax=Labrus bergylta TaxID=56723 RepID=A0A3Q3N136_9LABR